MSNKPVYDFYVLRYEKFTDCKFGVAVAKNSKGLWAFSTFVPMKYFVPLSAVAETPDSIYTEHVVDEYPTELFVNSGKIARWYDDVEYISGVTNINIENNIFNAKLHGRDVCGLFTKETDDWWEVANQHKTTRFLKA